MKKIHNKIIYLFLIIIFILFSIKNAEEYINFHVEKKNVIEYQNELQEKLTHFSLDEIQEIQNLSVTRTPDLWLLDQIVKDINTAKNKVFLETYILTEKRIQEALIKAYNRWIDVQVILEKNPYMAYNINNKSYNKLHLAWIPVVWSDPKDYSFNHSKFIIIDDYFYISTWNYSYSTFKYNRDFFLKSDDPEILEIILKIFNYDYIWEERNFYHPNIVLSPYNSRHFFQTYFISAEKTIDLYFQYFKDDALVDLLIQKQKKWVQVTAIIPKTALESNKDTLNKMEKSWINLHVMTKKKMHSKVIVIDKKYWFIWSINFSHYSLDKNRELGLLMKNPNIIKNILDYFKDDLANNTVKK